MIEGWSGLFGLGRRYSVMYTYTVCVMGVYDTICRAEGFGEMGSSFNGMLFPTSTHQGLCGSNFNFATGLPVPGYGGRTTGKRGLQRRVQWSGSWVRDIAILVYDEWGDGVILRDTVYFSVFPSGTETIYEKSEIEVDRPSSD